MARLHADSIPAKRDTDVSRLSAPARPFVYGYVRVSSEEQAASGAGLEAQRQAIASECERRGWDLARTFEDAGISGKNIEGRPGLTEAIAAMEGGAKALVVAKVDRISRSVLDFARVMQRAQSKGWAVVCLDVGVDTTTPAGGMITGILAVFAEFERRIIGERTRVALRVKAEQGVRLGRPTSINREVEDRVWLLRRSGLSYAAIAEILNSASVPTSRGGARWHDSTVRACAQRRERLEANGLSRTRPAGTSLSVTGRRGR